MMDVFESHDTIVIQTHADPRIAALVGALTDCIHPRAARLKARLAADPHPRAVLNRWLRRMVERLAVPNRAAIGDFIASVVARWDARTMADKLELHVGRDLQYIRLSGTLVGGCVGLAIHAVSRLLG